MKAWLARILIRHTKLAIIKDDDGAVTIGGAHHERLTVRTPGQIGEACIVHVAEAAQRPALLCIINPDAVVCRNREDHSIW